MIPKEEATLTFAKRRPVIAEQRKECAKAILAWYKKLQAAEAKAAPKKGAGAEILGLKEYPAELSLSKVWSSRRASLIPSLRSISVKKRSTTCPGQRIPDGMFR